MIPINKGLPPRNLVKLGEKHAGNLCAAYDADPKPYRGGKQMGFRNSIYASPAVKRALKVCHFGKCCYCETHIPEPYAYGHVEHWRPKSSSRQERRKESVWPGYYWLAYQWDNLLLSCAFCNSNKADLFPLKNPSARARHHRMRIAREKPALLKPDGGVNPRDHIAFRNETPVALTPLGKMTINVLALDSPKHEERLRHLQIISQARETFIDLVGSVDAKARAHAERARQILEKAIRPDQPYSAMVVDFLKANPLPDPPKSRASAVAPTRRRRIRHND